MTWIKSHTSIRLHPKVTRLRTELSISRPAAVGHLHLLWHWVLEYAPDGDLSRYSAAEIAEAAEWQASAADEFVAALVACGWLDRDDSGQLRVHGWQEYAGELLRRRSSSSAGASSAGASSAGASSAGASSSRPAQEPAGYSGIRAMVRTVREGGR